MNTPISPQEAAEALSAARAGRRKFLSAHSRRYPVLGLPSVFAAILCGFVAANAAPPWVTVLIDSALVLAIGLIVWALRNRYGVYVNGWRVGRGRWITTSLMLLYLADAIGSLGLKLSYGLWWAPLVGAVLLFPFALGANLLWIRSYRRWLEQGL